MKLEEIKAVKDQRPFQPFLIHAADGLEFLVTHPDAIAWSDESPRIVVCVKPNGGWQVIDVALVTSLGIQSPRQENGPTY
jgi:hypothetical protein